MALLTSLPFGVAAVAIIVNARHSKASGARQPLRKGTDTHCPRQTAGIRPKPACAIPWELQSEE